VSHLLVVRRFFLPEECLRRGGTPLDIPAIPPTWQRLTQWVASPVSMYCWELFQPKYIFVNCGKQDKMINTGQ